MKFGGWYRVHHVHFGVDRFRRKTTTPCYQPQNSGEQDLKKASNRKCVENMYHEAVLDSPGSIFLSQKVSKELYIIESDADCGKT